ncbi:MAG: metallophosphoesterase [Fidelibacterota bacterium]|nr:MAG: metallophosphoesterase [Candidatus Neomarinimicrobiota bacterium]
MKTIRMQNVCGTIPIILIVMGLNSCQDGPDRSVLLKGPYLQNVKTDGITVMWESAKPTIGEVVFGKSKSFGDTILETDSTAVHEVVLSGLDAETVYYYQVSQGGIKSGTYTFKTAVREDSPFSFAAYGDNKSGPFMHERVTDQILAWDPDLVVHNGDLVERGGVYKQWEKLFFSPARRLMRYKPLFPVLGNHEDNAQHYYDFFSLPDRERWYSFDYGNAHFIMLDSDTEALDEGGEQLSWLIRDMEENNATWTFVFFHHPPFTAGGNYYKKDRVYRKNILHPVFEKYGVDMVFNGHDHNYERTLPIVSREGQRPVTYIVCGNGGTPMRYIGQREWTLYAERVFGFVKVRIDGTTLSFQSINVDGKVIDEFALDKSDERSMADYKRDIVFFEDIHDPIETIEHYSAGDDLLDEEKYAEALQAFRTAFHFDTTCVEALAGIAECFYELGQIDSAMHYATWGSRKKHNYPGSYEVLADAHAALGDYERALEWCHKWLLIEPDDSGPNSQMAEIYAEQEAYDQAIQEMKNALAIVPSEADLHFELGGLYEKVGDQQAALAAYQKGLEWFMDEVEDDEVVEARNKVRKWTGSESE